MADDHREVSEEPIHPDPIILISVDTLRADHLGLYGHSRFTSPRLDLFAAEGVVFLDASSTAPWTLPAHASLFTGLYPQDHGVVTTADALAQSVPTVAETLANAGWDTAAVVNSTWLGSPHYQLNRGFQEFLFIPDETDRKLPSEQITNQAMDWLDKKRDAPLFLFMHYYDVHSDYTSLSTYEKMFVGPYEGIIDGTGLQLQLINLPESYVDLCRREFDSEKCTLGSANDAVEIGKDTEKPELNADDIRHLEELYDAGIRQIDDELGRFFSFLQDRGLLRSAAIIITSDHGEEFMDHGRVFHDLTTYQEILRIPLILRGRGIPTGLRLSTAVSIVDIPATILSWANVDPPAGTAGIDLNSLFKEGNGEPSRFEDRLQFGEASGGVELFKVMGEDAPLYFSVRKGPYKLVYRVGDERPSLYDLSADPTERFDIAQAHPQVAHNLWQVLEQRRSKSPLSAQGEGGVELDPSELERLRALGYILP